MLVETRRRRGAAVHDGEELECAEPEVGAVRDRPRVQRVVVRKGLACGAFDGGFEPVDLRGFRMRVLPELAGCGGGRHCGGGGCG